MKVISRSCVHCFFAVSSRHYYCYVTPYIHKRITPRRDNPLNDRLRQTSLNRKKAKLYNAAQSRTRVHTHIPIFFCKKLLLPTRGTKKPGERETTYPRHILVSLSRGRRERSPAMTSRARIILSGGVIVPPRRRRRLLSPFTQPTFSPSLISSSSLPTYARRRSEIRHIHCVTGRAYNFRPATADAAAHAHAFLHRCGLHTCDDARSLSLSLCARGSATSVSRFFRVDSNGPSCTGALLSVNFVEVLDNKER